MRKLTLFVVGCAVPLLLGAAPASADNGPHVAGAGIVADSCAGCHRAHTAQGAKLLKEGSQTDLCYTCHGTSGTGADSDVQNGIGYSGEGRSGGVDGALRGGGFEYALIDSANPSGQGHVGAHSIPVLEEGEPVSSTHSIDSSDQMIWGNGDINPEPDYGTTTQLRCTSCHDPHGNGKYRILRPVPEDSGAEPGVEIADAETKVYTTEDYWIDEDPNTPGYQDNISAWCSTCHTRYLASEAENSGDAVYTYRHRSDSTVHTSNPDCGMCHTSHGPVLTQYLNCATCHVAHGSNASMSGTYSGDVNFPDGSPGGSDSRLLRIDNRGICQMCHNR